MFTRERAVPAHIPISIPIPGENHDVDTPELTCDVNYALRRRHMQDPSPLPNVREGVQSGLNQQTRKGKGLGPLERDKSRRRLSAGPQLIVDNLQTRRKGRSVSVADLIIYSSKRAEPSCLSRNCLSPFMSIRSTF
jgi:hypothetical protein